MSNKHENRVTFRSTEKRVRNHQCKEKLRNAACQVTNIIKDRTNRNPDQMPGAAFGMHRHTLKLSRASTSDHIFPSLYLTPFSVGQGHYHYPGTECGSCSPGGPHSHGAPQLFFLLLFLLFPLLLLPYNSARIKQPSVLLEGKPP